jgi:hypothetical protein
MSKDIYKIIDDFNRENSRRKSFEPIISKENKNTLNINSKI